MQRQLVRNFLLLIIGVTLLAGCSAGLGGSPTRQVDSQPGAASEAQSASGKLGTLDQTAVSDRQIVTTGSATVTCDDPITGADSVARLVESAGGRVEDRREYKGNDDSRPRSVLSVRVPADKTTSTLDALDRLGTVESVNVSKEDVTDAAKDLDARIKALRTSVTRLEELMKTAGSTADLLATEKELSSRQASLESLTTQRTSLADQVSMSTLTLTLNAKEKAQPHRTGFIGGLSAGWTSLVAAGQTALVVVGALLPWLAVAAIIVAVVLMAVRWRRGRAAGAAPAAPGLQPSPRSDFRAASESAPGPTANPASAEGAGAQGRAADAAPPPAPVTSASDDPSQGTAVSPTEERDE